MHDTSSSILLTPNFLQSVYLRCIFYKQPVVEYQAWYDWLFIEILTLITFNMIMCLQICLAQNLLYYLFSLCPLYFCSFSLYIIFLGFLVYYFIIFVLYEWFKYTSFYCFLYGNSKHHNIDLHLSESSIN